MEIFSHFANPIIQKIGIILGPYSLLFEKNLISWSSRS